MEQNNPDGYEQFRKILGPCGLNCSKCIAFEGGYIQEAAEYLQELLGDNFSRYAARFAEVEPVFGNYHCFSELLDHLTEGTCTGCRNGECLFSACQVKDCIAEHGVDFCFQCDRFPCEDHGFPEGLKQLWERNNRMMRELGLEGYYQEIKDKPRYP